MGHRASPGKKAGRPARTTVRLETPADSSFSDSYGNDNKEDGKGGTYTFAFGKLTWPAKRGTRVLVSLMKSRMVSSSKRVANCMRVYPCLPMRWLPWDSPSSPCYALVFACAELWMFVNEPTPELIRRHDGLFLFGFVAVPQPQPQPEPHKPPTFLKRIRWWGAGVAGPLLQLVRTHQQGRPDDFNDIEVIPIPYDWRCQLEGDKYGTVILGTKSIEEEEKKKAGARKGKAKAKATGVGK